MNDVSVPEECSGLQADTNALKEKVRTAVRSARDHIKEARDAAEKRGVFSTADAKYQEKVEFHLDEVLKELGQAVKDLKTYLSAKKGLNTCVSHFREPN